MVQRKRSAELRVQNEELKKEYKICRGGFNIRPIVFILHLIRQPMAATFSHWRRL